MIWCIYVRNQFVYHAAEESLNEFPAVMIAQVCAVRRSKVFDLFYTKGLKANLGRDLHIFIPTPSLERGQHCLLSSALFLHPVRAVKLRAL